MPDLPPDRTRGINARAEVSAVIRIGLSLSAEPARMLSLTGNPLSHRCMYLEISSTPLRTAMPSRVMNPIVDGMLITPEDTLTAKMPPMSAKGSEQSTRMVSGIFLNSP